MPDVASHYLSIPVNTSHSHSIVNEPFLRFNINDLIIDASENTMKNTMFRNSCVNIDQDQGQVSVAVKINLSCFLAAPFDGLLSPP